MRFDVRFDPGVSPIREPSEVIAGKRVEFRGEKEEQQQRRPRPFGVQVRSKTALAALLLSVLHFRRQAIPRSLVEMKLQREAVLTLLHFRSLWAECLLADTSNRLDWLQSLSDDWAHLRDLEFTARALGCAWIADPIEAIRMLFDSPEQEQEFSLFYYLDLAAGSDWFPLPFLRDVLALHLENQKNPESNRVLTWMSLMSDVIRLWRFQSLAAHYSVKEAGESPGPSAAGDAQ